MLRRFWLLFAQATTVAFALLFVVATLRPAWLGPGPWAPQAAVQTVTVTEPAPVTAGKSAWSMPESFSAAVQRAAPAVVSIYTTKEVRRSERDNPLLERFFGDQPGAGDGESSLGSGVIASSEGLILTNHHVIAKADEILVALPDGRRVPAKLVGADPESDLALLRIDAPNLTVISIGDSEKLRVGDVVLAIGNPFNVGQTVTLGIVSALGRSNLGLNRFENFIQTDAAINEGNSGGALIDAQGNLVGINSVIYSRGGGSLGIGFAIPVSLARQIMVQLAAEGRVRRGYFGIEPLDISPELVQALKLPRKDGVVVRGVQASAPAGRAGIEPGDVLLSIDGTAVRDTASMLNQIAQLAPGSKAKVRVVRKERELEIEVEVGERPIPRDPR
jgi:serine protease DegQ